VRAFHNLVGLNSGFSTSLKVFFAAAACRNKVPGAFQALKNPGTTAQAFDGHIGCQNDFASLPLSLPRLANSVCCAKQNCRTGYVRKKIEFASLPGKQAGVGPTTARNWG
jgi:hypothetical protein